MNTCLLCGKELSPTPLRPQGGGSTKVYCNHNCASLAWARKNKKKSREIKRRSAAKPESKQRKREYANNHKNSWKRKTLEYNLLAHAKKRARDKGLQFTLKTEDIKIPELCPLLGVPLIKGKRKSTINSPSLDRINSTEGYTPDNIWVISHRANTIKSDASLKELKMLVEKLEEKMLERALDAPLRK